MSLLLIVRHTRTEEERGRTELVRAAAVGRLAPIAAAFAVVAATDMAIATLVALGLLALGPPAAGSLALGASLGATGLVFAGVGAVAAQLTGGRRLQRPPSCSPARPRLTLHSQRRGSSSSRTTR